MARDVTVEDAPAVSEADPLDAYLKLSKKPSGFSVSSHSDIPTFHHG
jgi:hypothetical protein